MTLRDRLAALINSIGADIKALGARNPFTGYITTGAASLTLTAAHHGYIIVLTGAGSVPVTVPATGLPNNFYCKVLTSSATGWFRVLAGSGATLRTVVPNSYAIKTQYAPADIFAIGTATYLVNSQKLTAAYMMNLVSAVPALAISTCRTIVEAHATNNILEVRRSTDNTTQAIGQVMSELDQASVTAFVGSGSGYYKTLYDQSGNGRNFAQATAANQPRLVAAGTLETLNTKPAMRGLVAGTWLDGALPITTSALTLGLVGSLNSAASSFARMASLGVVGSNDYNNVGYSALLNRNGTSTTIQTERNGFTYSAGTVAYATAFIYFVRFDGSNLTQYVNGVQVGKPMVVGSFNSTTLRMLASTQNDSYWDGYLTELVAFSTALPDADIASLTSHWKTYFNIP